MSHIRTLTSAVVLIVAASFLFGCAVRPKAPLTGIVPGKEVETLKSAISISVKTAERRIGGRGFLIFKRPDSFHLAILSPFGLTMVDIYSEGDRFTCLIPSRQTAYTGSITELPQREGLQAWAMMRWVVESTPVAGPAVERTNINRAGMMERLYYDDRGLLARKETEDGDRVVYRDYRNVGGVPFPEAIELSNSRNETVKIVFEDPEVNLPVEESTLVPRLVGIKVLPFSEFTGF